jgi:hypothetical protein
MGVIAAIARPYEEVQHTRWRRGSSRRLGRGYAAVFGRVAARSWPELRQRACPIGDQGIQDDLMRWQAGLGRKLCLEVKSLV